MDGSAAIIGTIVRLDDARATDPEVAGRKAATLARLLAGGFPVPAGAVLTSHGCQQILAAAGLGSDPAAEDIAACTIPQDVADELGQAIALLGDLPLAVRSSGIAEDLAGASYAGQYETVLGVRGIDQVGDAVRRCLASASSARVAAYRAAGGHSGPAPMAVLIQRMVEADAAGVAFTANPVTGDRETLVSAVRGLGERLVGGEATPDEWVIRSLEAECIAAPERAIDAEQARRIADLAARVEALFGVPQDIEWAMARGELVLLQARPITALPRPPQIEIPTEGYWMKDDTHYPMPLTPFGASVYLPALVQAGPPMGEEFGLLFERIEQRSLAGEAYMRLIPLGGKDRPAPPSWVLWIASRLAPPLRRRARAAEQAIRTGLAERLIDRWYAEWRPQFRSEADALLAHDLPALSDEELLGHLDRLLDFLCRGQVVHFLLWIAYGLPIYELAMACEELLGWDGTQALQLLSGLSEASSEPSGKLGELAMIANRSPAGRAAIEQGGADVLQRLREAAPEVAAAFADYLDRYCHRTASYDPGDPTLAERPELMAGLLRDRMRQDQAGAAASAPARIREETLAQARASLAGRPAREGERFERALAAAERAYPVREDNIIYVDNVPCALIRYTAMEAGRRLAARGVLLRADDVVYLEEGELRAALRGEHKDLRALVARRRGERAWVAAHPGPASYGKDPGPPPDLRPLPGALRHVNTVMMWYMAMFQANAPKVGDDEMGGAPGSPGRHTGPVRVVRDESEFQKLRPGDVLVCPITSPAWSVLFSQAGAVVADGGGVLAHAAVIAREHGIPAVLATHDATRRLRDGQVVTVDGSRGIVKIGSPD